MNANTVQELFNDTFDFDIEAAGEYLAMASLYRLFKRWFEDIWNRIVYGSALFLDGYAFFQAFFICSHDPAHGDVMCGCCTVCCRSEGVIGEFRWHSDCDGYWY